MTNVLFLCTGNSCRSQMAEGWARHLHGDRLTAHSAGVETHGLNQRAVQVMAEVGIDISRHRSQHIDQFTDTTLDLVVTVCGHAHESCPVFPDATRIEHQGFGDPPRLTRRLTDEEAILDIYRQVRDSIGRWMETEFVDLI